MLCKMSVRERERERGHLHLSNFNNPFSACHLRKLQFFYLSAYIKATVTHNCQLTTRKNEQNQHSVHYIYLI